MVKLCQYHTPQHTHMYVFDTITFVTFNATFKDLPVDILYVYGRYWVIFLTFAFYSLIPYISVSSHTQLLTYLLILFYS